MKDGPAMSSCALRSFVPGVVALLALTLCAACDESEVVADADADGDGDGDADGDGDGDGDSDGDGDGDSDGDGDGDGDADGDGDGDGDGDADGDCAVNSGYPCQCDGTAATCEDGSDCLAPEGATTGFCSAACTSQ